MRRYDTLFASPVRLTLEQLRNLPTVPVEVIPAPPKGKRIVIDEASYIGILYHFEDVETVH